ncbi:class I SAM-dependent methyltransferase [Sulfurimonas sp.]|uniref:class I SAM-dependent methyltransferase n=1 Tax=Sulfurimonas sp. TaxID=2022749 RepID=UPI002B4786FD|nr:class I SAM-dependent methyltransferase [Sulfurimonas sp.]
MPRVDNKKFYKSAINIHGTSPKGVNWNSKKSQNIRFKMILQMLPQNLKDSTVVDAGCGFGDFYTYALKHHKEFTYIGIDSLSDMYSIASEKTGCEILIADICIDAVPDATYYICSGAMNVLKRFETHLFIRKCFEASKKGFVFNILHGNKKSKTYNYFTKQDIQSIANDLGVKKVIFVDGYLDADITVGFFK